MSAYETPKPLLETEEHVTLYRDRRMEGGVAVNWGAYGNQSPKQARAYAVALLKAADLADEMREPEPVEVVTPSRRSWWPR